MRGWLVWLGGPLLQEGDEMVRGIFVGMGRYVPSEKAEGSPHLRPRRQTQDLHDLLASDHRVDPLSLFFGLSGFFFNVLGEFPERTSADLGGFALGCPEFFCPQTNQLLIVLFADLLAALSQGSSSPFWKALFDRVGSQETLDGVGGIDIDSKLPQGAAAYGVS